MNHWLLKLAFLPFFASLADAALTITIAPDGTGGTTFAFTQTAANPRIPQLQASTSSFQLDLPPGMFQPVVAGGFSDTYGSFSMIARFQDVDSSQNYDVVGLQISSVLSYAFFTFQVPLSLASGQTGVQLELVAGAPVASTISPEALVRGSHSISSVFFGTVTVNVIPESSSVALVMLSGGALFIRNRRRHEPS